MPDALQKSLTEGFRELVTGWPDKHEFRAPFNQFFLPFQYEVCMWLEWEMMTSLSLLVTSWRSNAGYYCYVHRA